MTTSSEMQQQGGAEIDHLGSIIVQDADTKSDGRLCSFCYEQFIPDPHRNCAKNRECCKHCGAAREVAD